MYRIDQGFIDEDERFKEEQAKNPNKKIWVEQVVKIFGEIHFTEKYSLMSKKKLRKMKLWIGEKPVDSFYSLMDMIKKWLS
ncbi:MAG: hypothetical protein ACKPKK_07185 [Dolichospermum sp.]